VSIAIAVLPAQEADQVGVDLEGGNRAAVLGGPQSWAARSRVNDKPAFDVDPLTLLQVGVAGLTPAGQFL